MALAYQRAAYTVVYPVVRGTGPIVTVLAAMVVFNESYGPVQWLGVGLLSGGILLLALRNLSEETLDLRALKLGLLWAMMGGALVAAYTTYDAWAIRAVGRPVCAFLVDGFSCFSSIDFAINSAWWRYRRMARWRLCAIGPWRCAGASGEVHCYVSFGGVNAGHIVAAWANRRC